MSWLWPRVIAYYVTDGPNTSQMLFYAYDIATGQQVGTIPSPFSGSGAFAAAAFVPEPASLLLPGFGLLGLRRRPARSLHVSGR